MDRRITLGNVLTMVMLLISVGGIYATMTSQIAVLSTKLDAALVFIAKQESRNEVMSDLRHRVDAVEREVQALKSAGFKP